MKTRASSSDGANLGHHAEPTLGEGLSRERSGSAVQSQRGANLRAGGDRAYYRRRGLQFISGSVADSTRRAYESGRRSWDKFLPVDALREVSEAF